MKDFAISEGKKLLTDEAYRSKVLGGASTILSSVGGLFPRREKVAGRTFEEVVRDALSSTPTKEDLAFATALIQAGNDRRFRIVLTLLIANIVFTITALIVVLSK